MVCESYKTGRIVFLFFHDHRSEEFVGDEGVETGDEGVDLYLN
jgi:hypothetical protein